MAKSYVRTGVFAAAMVVSMAGAYKLTPTPLYGPGRPPPIKIEQAVPEQFEGWAIDKSVANNIISPDLAAKLADLYSENVTRTYINAQGDRVMLSLAYGSDQSRALQIHKPEVCYEAQGFSIRQTVKTTVATPLGDLPLMRVLTQKSERNEPVSYWIRTGDVIIRGWWEQNKARVAAGLKGHHPDGILVRVSTIDTDATRAYSIQDQFIKDLVGSLKPDGQLMLLGAGMLQAQANPKQ